MDRWHYLWKHYPWSMSIAIVLAITVAWQLIRLALT